MKALISRLTPRRRGVIYCANAANAGADVVRPALTDVVHHSAVWAVIDEAL